MHDYRQVEYIIQAAEPPNSLIIHEMIGVCITWLSLVLYR